MAREDVAAGKVKQIRGKANDVIGAMRGKSSQQVKGKIQKGMGKVQEKMGKADRNRKARNGRDRRVGRELVGWQRRDCCWCWEE